MARRTTSVLALAALAMFAADGLAQTVTVPVSTPPATRVRASSSPQRDTLVRMMRPVAVEFNETRLEDAMKYIADITQADMEVFWQDERNSTGLDKESLVTLKVDRTTALTLVEKVLDSATSDSTGTGGNTWQLSNSGAFQVGPKERLNKFKRIEIYNVMDLMLEVPDYTNAPEFDLQSVLQSTGQGGGGGGQSPFREQGQNQQGLGKRPYDQRLQDLVDLLTTIVEPEQWVDNGGDGASIRPFQGNLLVNAPDYIHRQLNGYPYWPSSATKVATVNQRRYVTIGLDTSIAKVVGWDNVPITAVAGDGRLISSDPNRGPGGAKAPAPAKKPAKEAAKPAPASSGPK
ncbi:MAG: hypothetical protein HBSAPP03_01480 [Phycisphaerae bacterium]|nr:MAG: hypothetical protein HBSAPP03_01480 [Phycisphaerae bacterium]